MKSIHFFALSLLLSIAMPFPRIHAENELQDAMELLGNAVDDVEGAAAIVANEIAEDTSDAVSTIESSNLWQNIVGFPGYVVGGVGSIVSSTVGGVLYVGSTAIENSGVALTKVGDVGSYIVSTAQNHRTITGLVGLTAIAAMLTKTEMGRKFARNMNNAVRALLGLNEQAVACPCLEDHRTIALYLNQ